MFPFNRKLSSDPSQVPIINMKMLIIIHIMIIAFIWFIHWRLNLLHDF